MSKRDTNPELQKLFDADIPVYSFSKLETINNCLLSAYKTYIEHERGEGNIYSYLGTKIHDTLEALMNDKATVDDLLPAMRDELEDMEMVGVKFPENENGESTLRDNWVKDMEHFCKTYKKPRGTYRTEEFFLYQSSAGHYLQGYIDLIREKKDGSVEVYDYKTSSMYRGEDLAAHGRQLLLYAMALRQKGYTVNRVAWIFLKFVDVTYHGFKTAKSKTKTDNVKVIERRKIAQELEPVIRRDLECEHYDDLDIEEILRDFRAANTFDVLPEKVRKNYKMTPCVVEYPLTDETIAECEDYINTTIARWEALSGEEEDYPHRAFTKIQKNGKEVKETWFCTALCNHKNCEAVTDFIAQYEQPTDDDDDMFS